MWLDTQDKKSSAEKTSNICGQSNSCPCPSISEEIFTRVEFFSPHRLLLLSSDQNLINSIKAYWI